MKPVLHLTNIKFYCIFLLTFFTYTTLIAQPRTLSPLFQENEEFFEIGFRFRQLILDRRNGEQDERDNGGVFSENKSHHFLFQGGVTIQYFSKKEMLYRLTGNYFQNSYTSTTNTSHSALQDYSQRFSKESSLQVIPGIGKVFGHRTFTFKFGIELPFNIPFTNFSESNSETLEQNRQTSVIMTSTSPFVYNVKAQVFTDLEYNLFKKVYLELGMANGFGFSFSKGNKIDKIERFENEIITNSLERTEKINFQRFSFDYFQYYFGLNYRF